MNVTFAVSTCKRSLVASTELASQVLVVDGLSSHGSGASLDDSSPIPLPRETFNLPLNGFVDKVLIFGV